MGTYLQAEDLQNRLIGIYETLFDKDGDGQADAAVVASVIWDAETNAASFLPADYVPSNPTESIIKSAALQFAIQFAYELAPEVAATRGVSIKRDSGLSHYERGVDIMKQLKATLRNTQGATTKPKCVVPDVSSDDIRVWR